MELNQVIELIGSFGFPIAACIWLGYYVKELMKQYREDIAKLQQLHREEITAFKDEMETAVNNNTKALTELIIKLDKGGVV